MVTKIRQILGRGGVVATVTVYALLLVAGDLVLLQPQAHAAQLQSRSLTLSSSANGTVTTDIAGNAVAAGAGGNGAKTKETFDFTTATTSNVGSIDFLYCTTPLPGTTCTAPTGLDASTVTSVGGTSATGWSVGSAATSEVKITRTPGSISSGTALDFILGAGGTGTDYIKNPTTDNTTFFIRITTYSDAAYTTSVDTGTVASSTAQQIDVTAKVQETLGFSVGTATAGAVNNPTSSCTALTDPNSGAVTLGDSNGVLSSSQAYTANSYFRIYTNATNGAKVYYSGDTLKNGSNSITAIGGTAAASSPGTNQFGLTIGSDDTTTFGYSFTNLTAATNYNSTSAYAYNTASTTAPVLLASSSGIISCDTGSVKYIGNIATSTPAGIYTTTVSYIAVPTY